jgi:prevent-host-death family protein
MEPPMETYNIHEAKTHLSRLVDEAVDGKPFVIAKRGKQLVKVIPMASPDEQPKRRIGFMKGMFTLPDNFDEIDKQLDKEVERLFLGEDDE